MRTIIDLPSDQLEALAAICQREHISRAEAIRRAIGAFLETAAPETDQAFGLWKGRNIDALAYEQRLREEW